MGLRNGELLNGLCPGRIGPCDIDHVLHNGQSDPERVMFFEYKDGAPVPGGQKWLLRSLSGDYQERNDGRLLSVRHVILQQHEPEPEMVLRPAVDWLWPSVVRAR